jgi:hypothetical protein
VLRAWAADDDSVVAGAFIMASPKVLGRCSAARARSRQMASAVERGHVRVAVAGWRADRGEAGEVVRAHHEVGGGGVLL